jgi:hypothetical protein
MVKGKFLGAVALYENGVSIRFHSVYFRNVESMKLHLDRFHSKPLVLFAVYEKLTWQEQVRKQLIDGWPKELENFKKWHIETLGREPDFEKMFSGIRFAMGNPVKYGPTPQSALERAVEEELRDGRWRKIINYDD